MRSMNTTEQEMADAIAKILQPRKVLVAFWKALDEAIKEVDASEPQQPSEPLDSVERHTQEG